MTRHGFCYECRTRRLFHSTAHGGWECPVCGKQRAFSLEVIQEANKDKDSVRFWSEVKVTPLCWSWMRKSNNKKGPRFAFKGADKKIARVAYYLANGLWPKGVAFRTCGNGYCVRPDHIVDISQAELSRRLIKSGRLKLVQRPMKKCKRGHKFEGANIGVARNGNRFCRPCLNLSHRKWYKKQKRLARIKNGHEQNTQHVEPQPG